MSIAILAPRTTGFAANQSYLPALVQGEFVSNFSGFSAISVLDRQRLEDQYAELLSGYYDDNAQARLDLGHLTPTTHIMGGNITKTATGYALQMQITKTADKMTAASYSGTCTFAELDNLTGIRRASLELLEKMGVTPTERTRTELAGAAAANHVNAQTALAQGITAQKSGTVVEALSHFIQSSNYDPSLAEAASRMNILSASISSGNIGKDTRNDIAWRKQWVERLQEAETFFANYVKGQPYYLIYDTNIRQGDINYQNETVALSFWMGLLRDDQWVSTIIEVMRTVESGLLATGRAVAWGFDWPNKSVVTPSPFTDKTNNFTVVAEIINDKGRSIGKQSVTIPAGYVIRYGTIIQKQWEGNVSFQTVDANLITDRLTIRVTSIDGIPAETAAKQKRISILPETEYNQKIDHRWSSQLTIEEMLLFEASKDGSLKAIPKKSGRTQDLLIPPYDKNGIEITSIGKKVAYQYFYMRSVTFPLTVTEIGDEAFYMAGLFTSITIPNSVITIGNNAFTCHKDTELTSITIPNSVITIGNNAFLGHSLNYIPIPNSVRTIGNDAFNGHDGNYITIPNSVRKIGISAFGYGITSLTIGADVTLSRDNKWDRGSIGNRGNDFEDYYEQNNKKAGTYTYRDKRWTYEPR
jgi:hypothetical protein